MAVVLLLLNHCLLLLPLLIVTVFGPVVLLFSMLCPSSFAIVLMGKGELFGLL